ncbi:related to Protein BTN1 [Saccharomycodes ludwigii]|uniref:Protein BTN n=1 Tax=Saccharomycodes ludwigii TaxID=36035 RepID=A0A376B1W5_9ASCO|nr:related to Protein BTN1 [Saccharomycodes ludwigii]
MTHEPMPTAVSLPNEKTIFIFFWIFGLLNNVLYVVILSAAIDIVGTNTPKSIVLLADIIPSLSIKLLSPFFIHKISYNVRVSSLIIISISGMFLISMSSTSPALLWFSLLGIILASFSSGLGEVTFLQLTNYYSSVSLNGWSSGTGGAGLLGSFAYLLFTSILHVSVTITLLLFSILPLGFLIYFKLPSVSFTNYHSTDVSGAEQNSDHEIENVDFPLLVEPDLRTSENVYMDIFTINQLYSHLKETLIRLKKLIFPYMLPLSSVYFFEYLINQGVSPTLLFPITKEKSHHFSFFNEYRDMYVTYGTLYQLGVFISRSSGQFFRIKKLYLLTVLQGINLVITIIQSWYYPQHHIFPILILVFYEGLLGGSSYVNTFLNVTEDFKTSEQREFALGAVSISDSFGTMLAAFAGVWLEPKLCKHQVDNGRPWCSL